MAIESLTARRSVDALRFLRRGVSLLDAVVLIKVTQDGRTTMFNGLRITPELVIALRADTNGDGAAITVNDADAQVAWVGGGDALLLRTPSYEGALPDLSLAGYEGSVSLVWTNPAGEARIAFGRAHADAQHDVPTELGSTGAPLFDDAWGVVGLHKSYESQGGAREYVPIARLAREIEESPSWTEVASVHRLVRSVRAEPPRRTSSAEPDLARAVRWSADDVASGMPERARRRAMAGKSLADLTRARGADPATTPEQRAIDRILAGPGYALDTIDDEILLPFATAARWFRNVIPELPGDEALEHEVRRRRQRGALVAIVGPRFAPRTQESARLSEWLADRDRSALVIRGPGGIGKSALLAHFILANETAIRFAWIDFDRPDVSADERSITRVVDQHLAWQAAAGPLVVVLDSFESAVQTYGYTALNPALDVLATRFDDLAVVVGSRAPVPLLKVQGDPAHEWELPGLPLDVVTEWLIGEGVASDVAGDIAPVTNGVPLNMKLARDLVKGKSAEEARDIVASLPKHLVTGYMYRRILRRLRDDTLKDVAQWTMVPRRLVPELLADILHVTEEESVRVFAALRSEVTLIEGDATLTVRADLRNTLLPLLEAEDAGRVREIDTIAADFWSKRATDDAAAAEAVYHALRLTDTARAEQLWRYGLARHLGGYAMEELPAESQAWLEARVSRESADQATRVLLDSGEISKAAATLRAEPKNVRTLKGRRRSKAVETLASGSNVEAAPAGANPTLMESIVLRRARPAIPVRGGTFTFESDLWSVLEGQRPALERAVAATGRVQLGDGTVLGSAVRVGPDRFMTTRSVAGRFAVGNGHTARLIAGRNPAIDMRAEGGSASDLHAITRVVLLHPYWDIAIVEAPMPVPGVGIALARGEPAEGAHLVVVGHPGKNDREQQLVSAIFDNEFDVKRLMPGKYMGRRVESTLSGTVSAGLDDASALSADAGAPVFDPSTGEVIGVRFSWAFLLGAAFVPAWELALDPEMGKAGVALSSAPMPPPLPPPAWLIAWNTATPARHTLLDAHVARTSGDLARARALLDTVPDDDPDVRIDRALLLAACQVASDPLQAAAVLREVVDQNPRDAWPRLDRDDAIATHLRLVVDAEAERQFLEILHEQPLVAGLLDPGQFRVFVPPAVNLPWNRAGQGRFAGGSGLPSEAVAAATRIVDASERCHSLRGWIESNAKELASLDYLFGRPSADVRELAAAYVAYPYEMVRSTIDFLLEKTDLAPHPTKGWTPVVEPLFMMFRGVRGRLPEGVKTAKELEAWLDANATSGRLGSYLTELLRVDSRVAWQAGLLHLTTELPIERLLKRRFSAQASS